MKTIKIRKGLNIKLKGSAQEVVSTAIVPQKYCIRPTDFHGITPKMMCNVGDYVKRGSVVFHDKNNPEICFVSPCSGSVAEVRRGEKRKILEVVIAADSKDEAVRFDTNADKRKLFSEAGIYPLIIQRPYGIVADSKAVARDIFISFVDTAPLASDLEFVLKDEVESIKLAIRSLYGFTSGNVYLCFAQNSVLMDKLPDDPEIVKVVVKGKHPAGLVGTQINKLKPINKGDVVWTIPAINLPIIGRLLKNGEYQPEKLIAFAGSEVKNPQYYNIRIGADLTSLCESNLLSKNVRVISGNVLSGIDISKSMYLGFNDMQVSVIPEGDDYEMFGWLLPGADKCSNSRTFLSMLMPWKSFRLDTNTHGEERAYVVTGQYEKVCPLDIYPQLLVKAAITEDIDKMEELGIYEVIEEDLSLCEFVCTSKIEVQHILRKGLDLVRKEME
ncbi:MAG: Na(+)-translocating NADH-quinone reductase subunit A [Bacteroidales bacterium]|nr:Na(+)-translocating NADH-quinone reductase subunit A [Bacteroidales bacterium]